MSKEKPTDDPRQQTDWGSHEQTDKPWKGNPERSSGRDRQNPIWKSGTRPTLTSRPRRAIDGAICECSKIN